MGLGLGSGLGLGLEVRVRLRVRVKVRVMVMVRFRVRVRVDQSLLRCSMQASNPRTHSTHCSYAMVDNASTTRARGH